MPDLKKNALQREWQFRDATQQELLKFKEELRANLKNLPTNKRENLKKQILHKLESDKGLIQALNDSLKTYTPETGASWSLKNNKMLEILEGTLAFINSKFDHFIASIEDNRELADYQIKTQKEDITIIANTGPSIYGTSKSSFFKTALINTYLVCNEKNFLSDINLKSEGYWIDQTPNAHVTPLPEKLIPENIKVGKTDFTQCTYYHKDAATSKGLAFIHSGYAFGGYRNESRYPYQPPESLGKPNGPEDCSSFIGKLTLDIDQMSTADLWKRWQYQREGYPSDQDWENSTTGKLLINKYTVIESDNIQSNDIWATRSFDIDIDPDMKGIGKGGHTVLVIDDKDEKEIIGLGYNRDMPRIEGFGKKAFPKYSEKGDGKRIFFFRLQPQPQVPQEESKPKFLL